MLRIHFDYSIMERRTHVYAYDDDPLNGCCFEVTVKKIPYEGDMVPIPRTASMLKGESDTFFRALIVALEEFGKLPKSTATEAELKAVKENLEDFRRLVYERRTK